MTFDGKNVLITGSSRGIGANIALELAKFGLKVWINYKSNAKKADELKDKIIGQGHQAVVIGFDVSNQNDFKDAIKTIISCDGELSYLVNNAGITKDKLALRMSYEEFKDIVEANLGSAFIGSKEALKVMIKKRFGSVVNISSIVGERGNAGQANYVASKGGIIAMTKSFALEGANRNIRFNCVAPGFIQTDMISGLDEVTKNKYIASIPLGKIGEPKDIANAVAFLLSNESKYITGTTLRVNGGMYM